MDNKKLLPISFTDQEKMLLNYLEKQNDTFATEQFYTTQRNHLIDVLIEINNKNELRAIHRETNLPKVANKFMLAYFGEIFPFVTSLFDYEDDTTKDTESFYEVVKPLVYEKYPNLNLDNR